MQFEHTIFVNSPDINHYLTKDQVWKGMLERIYRPTQFNDSLERCEILNKTVFPNTGIILRLLDYGSFQLNDEVHINHEKFSIRIEVQAQTLCPQSYASMTLSDTPAGPAIHFQYISIPDAEHPELPAELLQLKHAAYQGLDDSFVQQLRLLSFTPVLT